MRKYEKYLRLCKNNRSEGIMLASNLKKGEIHYNKINDVGKPRNTHNIFTWYAKWFQQRARQSMV